jgi:hypothetical protein
VEYQKNLVPSGHHESARFYESANHLIDHLGEVPVLVVPCIVGRAEGRSAESVIAMYASIMPATWSFMLALRSRGLGSDHAASGQGSRGRGAPRDPGGRHPGGSDSCRLHARDGLQAGPTAARPGAHLLEPLGQPVHRGLI